MLDIEKQVVYWKNGAVEDWDVARDLIKRKKTRHGLSFAHLALEKLLKAHICRHTNDLAPRLHNLSRLAELTGLSLSQSQVDILAEMNAFNLEGRFPDLLISPPSQEEARDYLRRALEVYQWLMSRL